MLQKIHKLCDFFLGLLHPSHIIKLDTDIFQRLNFMIFLRWNSRDKCIRVKSSEDPHSDGYSNKRYQDNQRASQRRADSLWRSIKNNLCLWIFVFFMSLDHFKKVIDIPCIIELLCGIVIVLKCYVIVDSFVFLLLFYVDYLKTLE